MLHLDVEHSSGDGVGDENGNGGGDGKGDEHGEGSGDDSSDVTTIKPV